MFEHPPTLAQKIIYPSPGNMALKVTTSANGRPWSPSRASAIDLRCNPQRMLRQPQLQHASIKGKSDIYIHIYIYAYIYTYTYTHTYTYTYILLYYIISFHIILQHHIIYLCYIKRYIYIYYLFIYLFICLFIYLFILIQQLQNRNPKKTK